MTPLISPTPTQTPQTIGAEITAFGVARADGQVVQPICPGCATYVRPPSGFLIYVEAGPGISRRPVGTVTFNSNPSDPNVLPDFQIMSSRALGNGSAAICDDGPAPDHPLGGVPGVQPPVFGGSQAAANAINDLSCRFDVRTNTSLACTRDPFTQVEAFVAQGTTVQFCISPAVGTEIAFPPGDTTLTVRVRDALGQPGHPQSIVIRVPPTPTPMSTWTPTPTWTPTLRPTPTPRSH